MQSGLWKYWTIHRSSRKGAVCLAGVAVALVMLTGTRSQAERIPIETRLSVETSHAGGRAVSTFSVHVEPGSGEENAAGIVTLVEGDRQLGSAALGSDGNASIPLSDLPSGTHSIHAVFTQEGAGQLATSRSLDAQVIAEATGVPDFAVSATPTSLSVTQGNEVTSQLTLSPINGFSGYVTLSCSNLTPDSQCGFVPVNVFVGGSTTSPSVLSVITYGPTGPDAQLRSHSTLVYALLIPGLLGMVGLGMRGRRIWQQAGLLLIVITVTTAMSGCSQRYHYLHKSPVASPGTPIGATTFVLEEQSISGTTVITHQTTLALTVKAPTS